MRWKRPQPDSTTHAPARDQFSRLCGAAPAPRQDRRAWRSLFDPGPLDPKARKAFPLRLNHFLVMWHRLERELAWSPCVRLRWGPWPTAYANDYAVCAQWHHGQFSVADAALLPEDAARTQRRRSEGQNSTSPGPEVASGQARQCGPSQWPEHRSRALNCCVFAAPVCLAPRRAAEAPSP